MYIIITRPEHDICTRYLSHWSKKFIEECNKKGYTVLDLYRKKASKKELEGRIKKVLPSFVFLNGHGNEECVTGHNDEPLVTLGKNENILKKRITYALSCSVACKLGEKVADKNTTFIGYKKSFIFNARAENLRNPLKDKRAKKFLEPANKVSLSIIKNHSAEEAVDISRKEFAKQIKENLPYADDAEIRDDLSSLYWNMKNLVCLGDKRASIS